jgi:hypothetical protein
MKFLAYFDYLGFKDFIERNDVETQQKIILSNFRDIEMALAEGKIKQSDFGVVADLSKFTLGCTIFSDTVLFWSQDNSIESLQEILITALRFNWQCIDYCFPARGSIVYGEFNVVEFNYKGVGGGKYNINSVFGKGLIQAYQKAEGQNWAGTVIDNSVISFLESNGYDLNKYVLPFAKKYKVPYRDSIPDQKEEWVLNLVTESATITEEAFKNMKTNIIDNFSQYNKRTNDTRVQQKIANTIDFLSSYRR